MKEVRGGVEEFLVLAEECENVIKNHVNNPGS